MNQSERSAVAGFHGATGNVPLVDLLQVWSMNRFSGLVVVDHGGRAGHLYFVEGEIVHAEAGDASGEQAVGLILAWPGGAFEPIPNTTTLKRTISKRLSHLLLDAHRVIDERRREPEPAMTPPPALTPPPLHPAGERAGPTALDRVRTVPGVTRLVRFGRDGRPPQGEGAAGEALAAKGLYLAINHAGAIGAAFGLRDLVLASVQGDRESFLIVHGGGNYLAVAVGPGVAMEPVAAEVRSLLTRQAAR
jgi:uncharacterized protein DUF4388